MAVMANSMLAEEVTIGYTQNDYKSGSSDNYAFINLTSLEDIAEKWGGDWEAVNVSSGSNAIHWIEPSDGDCTLKSGKSIPMLKNTTLYPNLGICLPCTVSWYDHAQLIYVDVINLVSGECLSCQLISDINVDIYSLSLYSFNANVKAIGGAENRGQEWSCVIFTAQGIITTEDMHSSGCNSYRIILPDGTTGDTNKHECIVQANRTHFEPVYCDIQPTLVFNGIYIMTRGTTRTYSIVNFGGITYDIFGTNRTSWSDTNNPIFVVSSEILE